MFPIKLAYDTLLPQLLAFFWICLSDTAGFHPANVCAPQAALCPPTGQHQENQASVRARWKDRAQGGTRCTLTGSEPWLCHTLWSRSPSAHTRPGGTQQQHRAQQQHHALTPRPHTVPSHCARPCHALTPCPHTAPSHHALTPRPHTTPSHRTWPHCALTLRPHTAPSHRALTPCPAPPHPHTMPSHCALPRHPPTAPGPAVPVGGTQALKRRGWAGRKFRIARGRSLRSGNSL